MMNEESAAELMATQEEKGDNGLRVSALMSSEDTVPWRLFSEKGLRELIGLLGIPDILVKDKNEDELSSLIKSIYDSDKEHVLKKVRVLTGIKIPQSHEYAETDFGSPHSVRNNLDDKTKRSKLDVKAPPRWNGGSLYEWKRWVRTFLDIAEELKYDESEGVKRLRRYTDSSSDFQVVEMLLGEGMSYRGVLEEIERRKVIEKSGDIQRFLDDVKQEKDSVAMYLSRFEKNAQEIEKVEGTNFSLAEKIRAFEKGLWIRVRLRIPVSHIEIDKSSFRKYTDCILQVEAQVKREVATLAELRKERGIKDKDRTENKKRTEKALADVAEERKMCFAWRKNGKCRFGTKSKWSSDHQEETKGVNSKKNDIGSA
jgi:hypothetical protein